MSAHVIVEFNGKQVMRSSGLPPLVGRAKVGKEAQVVVIRNKKRQVIGVFSPDWQRKMAEVLKLLGSEHAMIVHSEGLDEIRLDAPTRVVELKGGDIQEYELHPNQFEIDLVGPDVVDALSADSTEASLKLVRAQAQKRYDREAIR